jgi:hypothetical protein
MLTESQRSETELLPQGLCVSEFIVLVKRTNVWGQQNRIVNPKAELGFRLHVRVGAIRTYRPNPTERLPVVACSRAPCEELDNGELHVRLAGLNGCIRHHPPNFGRMRTTARDLWHG